MKNREKILDETVEHLKGIIARLTNERDELLERARQGTAAGEAATLVTRKMFRDQVDGHACPECQGTALRGWSLHVEGDGTEIRQSVRCFDCGASWFDTWTLSTRTVDAGVDCPYVIEFF